LPASAVIEKRYSWITIIAYYCKLESFLEFSPTLPKFEASLP
jgi:hypothetical protein